MFRNLCLMLSMLIINSFGFARDLEANLIKRVNFDSNTGNGSQIQPISFSSNNEFFYIETFFNSLEYTRPTQFRKTDLSGTMDLQDKIGRGIPCITGVENCWANEQSYNVSASSKGMFSVYNYSRWESTGSNTVLVQSSINNGPALDNILLDLDAGGYKAEPIIKVNNNGVVVVFLEKKIWDSVQLPYELAVINPDGTKRTLTYIRYSGISNYYGISLEINDFDTVFYWDGFKVTAFEKNGNSKIVADIPYHEFLLRYPWFTNVLYAPNISSDEHPEGILYYKKYYNQIHSTQDGLIVDASSYGSISNFAVNENKKIVYTAFNAPYNATSSAIFVGPDLVNDKLIESGEKINGEVADLPISLGLNENLEFLIGYGTKPNPYHAQHQREVFVKASLKPKECDVEVITGRQFNFMPQTAYGKAPTGEKLGFPLKDPVEQSKNTIHDYGCVLSAMTMLFDFYGFTDPNDQSLDLLKVNELFKYAHDALSNRPLITFSKDEKSKKDNNNIKYAPAVEAGRTLVGNKCWKNSINKDNLDRESCYLESAGSLSYVPGSSSSPHSWQNSVLVTPEVITKMEAGKKAIEAQLCLGKPVFLRVGRKDKKFPTQLAGHTVIATASFYDANGKLDFRIKNPGATNGGNQTLSQIMTKPKDPYIYFTGYEQFVTEKDPSMISIHTADADFVLTDSSGKRAGYDPILNREYNEFPGGQYISQSTAVVDEDSEDVSSDDGILHRTLVVSGVTSGEFKIKVFPKTTGTATFEVTATDTLGFTNSKQLLNVPTQANLVTETIFKHSDKKLVPVNSELIIQNAVYTNPNFQPASTGKGKQQLQYQQSIHLVGRLKLPENSFISGQGKFNLSVGSIADYNLVIPMSSFSASTDSGLTQYRYSQNNIDIRLREDGFFNLQIMDSTLNSIGPGKWGLIEIGVNGNTGTETLNLVCAGNICRMDRAD